MLELWNKRYKNVDKMPCYDNWLDDYKSYFCGKEIKLLEIGAGTGPNVQFYNKISKNNIYVCDFSVEALEILKKRDTEINVFAHDITQNFEFENNFFDIIVSDLSLHYFDKKTTKRIVHELKRILKVDGLFFLRVNAVGDFNSGYKNGLEIENNYFKNDENFKKFFCEKSLLNLFKGWNKIIIKKTLTRKYGTDKKCLFGVFKNSIK